MKHLEHELSIFATVRRCAKIITDIFTKHQRFVGRSLLCGLTEQIKHVKHVAHSHCCRS